MRGSMKLKKAVAQGKVMVYNPRSGEANLFLLDENQKQFSVLIPGKATVEIAPKYCPLKHVARSRNLDTHLKAGHLRIV